MRSIAFGLGLLALSSAAALSQEYPPEAQPNPYTVPTMPSGKGVWTFGIGASPTATVDYPAIDPRAGRIGAVLFGGSTDYSNANVVATSNLGAREGVVAFARDTITVSGAGQSLSATTQVTASCLSAPCVAQQHFGGNLGFSNGTILSSTVLPYTSNSAQQFVAANQALYGPQTATITSSTAPTSVNGSLTTYTVTGNYNIVLGRVVQPWTSDDVLHGQLNVPRGGIGAMLVIPTPALGFTAQEAANLSGFNNFNYIQKLTSSGTFSTDTYKVLTHTTSGYIFPGDTSKVGDFDPLHGGNQDRPGDHFDPYWDQVKVGTDKSIQVLNHNFGLQFEDAPNLNVAGRYLSFSTQLVGVTQTSTTDLTYTPLFFTSDGTEDPTLKFNWAFFQVKPYCNEAPTGCALVFGAPSRPGEPPYGVSLLLGYGDMTDDQIAAAINDRIGDLAQFAGAFQTAVPEPSTWAMMIVGFVAVTLLAHGRRNRLVAAG